MMKWVTKCGWHHAPEVCGGFGGFRRKLGVETRRRTRWLTFGLGEVRRICAPWVPHKIGTRWRSQHKKIVSSPYVETINSKVIKRFRAWTKKSLCVFEFWDSCVLSYLYGVINIMNTRCPFHPFRTWPYLYIMDMLELHFSTTKNVMSALFNLPPFWIASKETFLQD